MSRVMGVLGVSIVAFVAVCAVVIQAQDDEYDGPNYVDETNLVLPDD